MRKRKPRKCPHCGADMTYFYGWLCQVCYPLSDRPEGEWDAALREAIAKK